MADRTQKGLNTSHMMTTPPENVHNTKSLEKVPWIPSCRKPLHFWRLDAFGTSWYIFCDFSDMLLILTLDKLNQEYENCDRTITYTRDSRGSLCQRMFRGWPGDRSPYTVLSLVGLLHFPAGAFALELRLLLPQRRAAYCVKGLKAVRVLACERAYLG